MNRLAEQFEQLRTKNEGALVAYLMAGDPDPLRSLEYAMAMEAGGADVIELGLPFSDPIADGPTIQAAGVRAFQSKITMKSVVQIITEFRALSKTPLVVMSYYNPIWKMGEESFLKQIAEAGADGVAIPDLPIEEATNWLNQCRKYHMSRIFFVTPETDDERAKKIAEQSTGFLYLVPRYGTTGARDELASHTANLIQRVRPLMPEGLPLAVGFGLSSKEQVQTVITAGADAAIVGSAIVDKIGQGVPPETLMLFVRELKDGTRRSASAAV